MSHNSRIRLNICLRHNIYHKKYNCEVKKTGVNHYLQFIEKYLMTCK